VAKLATLAPDLFLFWVLPVRLAYGGGTYYLTLQKPLLSGRHYSARCAASGWKTGTVPAYL
jgi:hypothetical protein